LRVRVCRLLTAALLVALAGIGQGVSLYAETPVFDATHLPAPSEFSAKWFVHAGDDPAYARPDFDDSQWTLFDPTTSFDKIYGKSRPSIVWYRLRVKVDPAQKNLALNEFGLAHAFEIYVNGERLITVGRVAPFVAYTYRADVVKKIPERQIATGTLLIAMRMYIMPSEWAVQGEAGYGSSNLRIGQYDALDNERWLRILGTNLLSEVANLFSVALGIVALVLFFSHRKQTEYLWIAGLAAFFVIDSQTSVIESVVNIPLFWKVAGAALQLIDPWLWGSLYFSFVHQRVGWRWRMFFAVAGIMEAAAGVATVYFPNNIVYAPYLLLPSVLLTAVIIPIVLIQHWRKGNREAGIMLIPVALSGLNTYALFVAILFFNLAIFQKTALVWLNALQHISVGPVTVSSGAVGKILFIISMGVIILLRSSRMSKRQAQLESELEAAQQVQQVLVPEETSSVPGFAVDAVYLPAQQVGGDFFQVLPAGQGGLLVVVGDVAGKGLPAAMLVSALVGSIRTAADDTHAPDEVLQRLNERLVGRTQGGFTTALAAYIAADGTMTIANAGHLPPYLDSEEVELDGALPLGFTSNVRYETRKIFLPPGGRLTFYSDGVIEAQNQEGELFGFDRARELAGETADAIARQAQEFGQRDDITVVTIARERAVASAA